MGWTPIYRSISWSTKPAIPWQHPLLAGHRDVVAILPVVHPNGACGGPTLEISGNDDKVRLASKVKLIKIGMLASEMRVPLNEENLGCSQRLMNNNEWNWDRWCTIVERYQIREMENATNSCLSTNHIGIGLTKCTPKLERLFSGCPSLSISIWLGNRTFQLHEEPLHVLLPADLRGSSKRPGWSTTNIALLALLGGDQINLLGALECT